MHNDWNDNTWQNPTLDTRTPDSRTELQLQFVENSETHTEHNLRQPIERPALPTVDTKNASPQPAVHSQTAVLSQDWISAFNTSLLTTRAQTKTTQTARDLGALMESAEFASIVAGAQHLAASERLSKEEATERLIEVFRALDDAWKQLVIKRGIQAMIE